MTEEIYTIAAAIAAPAEGEKDLLELLCAAAEQELTVKELSALLGDISHRFVLWNETESLAMPAHHRKMAERYFLRKPRPAAEQLPL